MKKSIEIVNSPLTISSCVGQRVREVMSKIEEEIEINDLSDFYDDPDWIVEKHPPVMFVGRLQEKMSTKDMYETLRATPYRPVPLSGLIIFVSQYLHLAHELRPIAPGGRTILGRWGETIQQPSEHNGWKRIIQWHISPRCFSFRESLCDPGFWAIRLTSEFDGWPEGTHILLAPRKK